MDASREDRLQEFIRRLQCASAASSFSGARELIADTLNAVESTMTTIPFDPSSWQTDGRMYPPQDDALRAVDGRDDLKRYRTKNHNIFIRNNGAFEIQETVGARVLVARVGSDGTGVWEP